MYRLQQETIMGSTDDVGLQFVKQSDDKIIQGYYNLKHLVMFTNVLIVIQLNYI